MLCSGLLALWQHPQQKNVWLERAKKLGWGPGGYVAPQAARHPMSASAMSNPHPKMSFARLGRGGPGGGLGRGSG